MKINVTDVILEIDGKPSKTTVRSVILTCLLGVKREGDDLERKLKLHRIALRVQAEDTPDLSPLERDEILHRAAQDFPPLIVGQIHALLNESEQDVVPVARPRAVA